MIVITVLFAAAAAGSIATCVFVWNSYKFALLLRAQRRAYWRELKNNGGKFNGTQGGI